MAEATPREAGGRVRRPLAVCALALASFGAPACAPAAPRADRHETASRPDAPCTAPAPRAFASEQFVYPLGAGVLDDRLLVVGNPAFRALPTPAGELIRVDTMFAGVALGADRAPSLLARPAGVRAFNYPRILPRADGTVDVVWSEPLTDVREGAPYTHRILAGRFDGARWTRVDTIGVFRLAVGLSRQMGSDLVRIDGTTYMAFPSSNVGAEAGTRPDVKLVVISDFGGRWGARRIDVGMGLIGSVEIAEHEGALFAVFEGIAAQLPRGRVGRVGARIWHTRLRGGSADAPQPLTGEAPRSYQTPRIVRHGTSIIAAWIATGPVPALEWVEVRPGEPYGEVRRLSGAGMVQAGQAPWRDVLAVAMVDGSTRVLRLRDDGHDVLATVPTGVAFVPTIAGPRDRPVALVAEEVPTPDPGPIRLVAYDLRCALRR